MTSANKGFCFLILIFGGIRNSSQGISMCSARQGSSSISFDLDFISIDDSNTKSSQGIFKDVSRLVLGSYKEKQ